MWEGDVDVDPPSRKLAISIKSAAAVLCCVLDGKWCPVFAERTCHVGMCLAQGHPLKPSRDYSDLLKLEIINAEFGDPRRIYIRSVDRGRYLLFLRNTLCERAHVRGTAGAWEKLQLFPTSSDDPHCFHLKGRGSSAAFICFDKVNDCFVQGPDTPGCPPVVFAFQSAAAAQLQQEMVGLACQCATQKSRLGDSKKVLRQQRHARRGTPAELSESFGQLSRMHDEEEERLVFLQDNLAFSREQVECNLLDEDVPFDRLCGWRRATPASA